MPQAFTKIIPLLGLLAGCTLLPEHAPLPQYALTAPVTADIEGNPSSSSVLIDLPRSDASLNTQRIAVNKGGYRRDYFAQSEWTDKLPVLVQDILLQTFQNAEKFKGVSRPDSGIISDYMLQSDLREFAAHYDGTGAAPRVIVNAHVRLMDMKERKVEASRLFSLERQAPENNLESVVFTFNEQVQEMALQILEWALAESGNIDGVQVELDPDGDED